MERWAIVVLAALLAPLTPTAAGAVRPVHSIVATVTIKNATGASLSGWTLRIALAKGTRLRTVTGGAHAATHSGTVTLKGSTALGAQHSRTLQVHIDGAKAPKHWTFASRACTVKRGRQSGTTAHLTVSCATQTSATAQPGGGGGPATPGQPPATGGPSTGGSTPAAGAAPWGFRFAPYADMSGASPPDLAAARTQGGVKDVTLGFVTASKGTDCTATWGGYAAYPAAGSSAYQLASVNSSRAAGGDVVISFGGQAGAELATVCPSVSALAAAYGAVISAYNATHVDFDIEGAAITNTAANTRRSQAIAELQGAAAGSDRNLSVSYTLPVEPSGLDSDGVAVLRDAVANGVQISLVNIMAMDYGDGAAPNPSGKMATYAIDAAKATAGQLGSVFSGLSSSDVLARLGVTPMIGVNDQQDEVFTHDDATALEAYAAQQHIGALAMWSLGRDQQCGSPQSSAQDDCSSVSQSAYDFSRALGAYTG